MPRSYLAAAVLALCTLAFAQEAPEKILQQAVSKHQAGDVEGAIELYHKYLAVRPDSPSVRSDLGVALSRAGRYDEAIAEYQAALKKAPDPRVAMNLALAFYKSGQISKAAAELSPLHKMQPANQQITLLLADSWLRMGEDGKVVELLTPLEKQSQDNLAIAYLLGTALLRDKKPERAQQYIDRILRNGDSAEARLLMATAKLSAMDNTGAIADLEKAVQLNPRLPEVWSYLGRAQMDSGNGPAARIAFQKELQRYPNDFESNLNLAVLMKQEQDYAGARKLLARALRVRPGDFAARFQVAAVDLLTGKIEDARVNLENIVKEAPQFVEAHVSLAGAYYRLKRKADGDREREIVQRLNAELQAQQTRGEVQK